MYQVLTIEDFPDDAELLAEALERYGRTHNESFEVTRGDSARAMASGTRDYDLIFLDIELPGMDGMEAARLLRSYDPSTPVVFVTSLAQYAIEGYGVDAAGFIVKPVTQPKLELCMDKVMRRLRSRDAQKITLNVGGGVRVVPTRDIRYVELIRHDLWFHMQAGNEPLKLRGTIGEIEERLTEDGRFLRISSGCLVNMDCVRLIKGTTVELDDGTSLALSRSRRANALETFSSYLGTGA